MEKPPASNCWPITLASSLAGATRRVKIARLKGAAIANTCTDAETNLETQPVPSCAALGYPHPDSVRKFPVFNRLQG